jgi:hypothetical protein
MEHATASLRKPFPQAAELAAARERSRQIDEQLEAAATTQQSRDAEASGDSSVPARHESPVTSEPSGSPAPSRATDTVANRPQPIRDDIHGTAPGQLAGLVLPSRTTEHHRQHDPGAPDDRHSQPPGLTTQVLAR